MKSMYKILSILTLILLSCSRGAMAQDTTYIAVGSAIPYTVPATLYGTAVYFELAGGSGGPGLNSRGGYGGRVSGWLTVTPGQVLNVWVGRAGNPYAPCCGFAGADAIGGTPDGGFGTNGNAGAGGGSSSISFSPYTAADRMVVGGGGGGGGYNPGSVAADDDRGGDGGYDGENGYAIGGNGLYGGNGGSTTLLTGGSAGTYLLGSSAIAGGFWSGGKGDKSALNSAGGGGGGGYYGGGGGSQSGGGGGSSYYDPANTYAVIENPAYNTPGMNPIPGFSMRGWVEICAPPPPTGTISGPSMCVGDTATFLTTCYPGGVWSSSATGVATVGTNGFVTAVTNGITTLTYVYTIKCGTQTATFPLVVNALPSAITGGSSVCMGDALSLSDATLGGTWSSGTTSVGTISTGTGVFTPASTGVTMVTYTSPLGCINTTAITVPPTPPLPTVPAGGCVGLTATLTDAMPGGKWFSYTPVVADVDSISGLLTTYRSGATIITYTMPTGCFSTVVFPTYDSAMPIYGDPTLCEASVTVLYEAASFGVWSSDALGVATVSSGVVTGVSGGTVNIDYTVPGCPAKVHPMIINPLPATITGSTSICIGVAGALYDASAGGTWASNDTTLAVIDQYTGVIVTGDSASVHLGAPVTISYTLPTSCMITSVVYVNQPPTPISGIDSVCQGSSVVLVDAVHGGTWSSTDIAKVPVDAITGVVTGVAAGTATISYNMPNGCYQLMPFRVLPPIPAFVNVVSTKGTDICEGTADTFIAYPTNGGFPTYKWKKFLTYYSDTTDTFSLTPIHGDVIYCEMVTHGICSVKDTVYDTVAINVWPDVAPTVVISLLGASDSAHYLGEEFTLFSNVTNGGPGPTYQWFKNGVAIPGATHSSYAATIYHNDTFSLQVIGNPPCDASMIYLSGSNSIVLYGDQLGVNPLTGNNTLFLFPNPNNGSFVLSGKMSNTSAKDITYEVSNMLGQVVYTGKAAPQNGMIKEQITINDLSAGSYLLRVNSENGNEVFHFVVSK